MVIEDQYERLLNREARDRTNFVGIKGDISGQRIFQMLAYDIFICYEIKPFVHSKTFLWEVYWCKWIIQTDDGSQWFNRWRMGAVRWICSINSAYECNILAINHNY